MAYQLHYWADDNGKGQYELRNIRLKRLVDAQIYAKVQNRPSECVLVTVTRTDNQSPIEKEIWRKPGYDVD